MSSFRKETDIEVASIINDASTSGVRYKIVRFVCVKTKNKGLVFRRKEVLNDRIGFGFVILSPEKLERMCLEKYGLKYVPGVKCNTSINEVGSYILEGN